MHGSCSSWNRHKSSRNACIGELIMVAANKVGAEVRGIEYAIKVCTSWIDMLRGHVTEASSGMQVVQAIHHAH